MRFGDFIFSFLGNFECVDIFFTSKGPRLTSVLCERSLRFRGLPNRKIYLCGIFWKHGTDRLIFGIHSAVLRKFLFVGKNQLCSGNSTGGCAWEKTRKAR